MAERSVRAQATGLQAEVSERHLRQSGIDGGIEVGIDTGGTFTDVIFREPDRPVRLVKIPSTPADPSEAIIEAVHYMAREWGTDLSRIVRFVHGTTVGTNAVLERKGARIGLLATKGFADVLEIGRHMRDSMYTIKLQPGTPLFLLPGMRRKEVVERVDAKGNVLIELDLGSARKALEELVADGVESIAVCYLFSFLNPKHEILTRELIEREFPMLTVSLSSEVDPFFREYERTVVTAFDAYIKPVIGGYLERLEARLKSAGVVAPLQLMQSRGGVAAGAVARKRPVRLFLSGPAGGVIGGRMEGALVGERNLITIDIGGTSSDIALISDGVALTVSEGRIGGWPVRVPMVGVHSIGAGGGSIARLDAAGGLRVGPESAGANPGPACYARGGSEATVTDASVVLGYLNPSYFAGGLFQLQPELARKVIRERIARTLTLSVEEAAVGIHRVINASMAEGIRLVSIRQGYDPRKFALVSLGGAGPVHATALARELGIDKIIIPRHPGVLSAAGLLAAPIEHEVSATFQVPLAEAQIESLRSVLHGLDIKAKALMDLEGEAAKDVELIYSADVCYIGQSHFLEIPLQVDADDPIKRLYRDFIATHDRVYGHGTECPATIVSVRSTHRAKSAEVFDGTSLPQGGRAPEKQRRRVFFLTSQTPVECPVYERLQMPVGIEVLGPAIVEQADTTTVIEPGWRASVLKSGSLALRKE